MAHRTWALGGIRAQIQRIEKKMGGDTKLIRNHGRDTKKRARFTRGQDSAADRDLLSSVVFLEPAKKSKLLVWLIFFFSGDALMKSKLDFFTIFLGFRAASSAIISCAIRLIREMAGELVNVTQHAGYTRFSSRTCVWHDPSQSRPWCTGLNQTPTLTTH